MSKRAFFLATGLPVAFHFFIWQFIILLKPDQAPSWIELLSHWDSGWYNKIIEHGYLNESWAFMPGYPAVVWVFSKIISFMPVPLLGAFLSSIFFTTAMVTLAHKERYHYLQDVYLAPRGLVALLLFTFAPASYVYHSHHTEALYLVLSLATWLCIQSRLLMWSILFAGLAALTRIQGYVLLFAGTVFWFDVVRGNKGLRVACLFALGSGAIASLYPLWQWVKLGDPLYFLSAQQTWTQDVGANYLVWLKALWLGNAWQPLTVGSIIHNVYFVVLIVASIFLMRRARAVGLYCLLCLGCMFPQGEFVDVLRYSAVLFPLHFYLGDVLTRMAKPFTAYAVVALMVLLNMAVAYNYAIGRWAY